MKKIIIILLGIVLICAVLKWCWYSSLPLRIKLSFKTFCKNRAKYPEYKLHKLQANIKEAISRYQGYIANQRSFLEAYETADFEYRHNTLGVQEVICKEEKQISEFQRMLAETEREFNRREHSLKYK